MTASTNRTIAELATAANATARRVPGPRRMARRVPVRSAQSALVLVMREVMKAAWQPATAAARLLNEVPDLAVLRLARSRVRIASLERATVFQARALATLNLAITELEDRLRGPGPSDHVTPRKGDKTSGASS
jgi:hypothetical protein